MKIVVDLIANTGTFVTDMGRASKATEKEMKRIRKNAEDLGKAMGVAFVAAGAAVATLVKQSVNFADQISKTSQKVGVSTEALSQLSFAAELSDVSLEALNSSLQKQSVTALEAARGSDAAAAAYAALGISADDLKKSNEELFTQIADGVSRLQDGAEKVNIVRAIFGKSGAELIPLLNEGADGIAKLRDEADRLGLTIDQNTGKAAEEFNDSLTRIKAIVRGVGLTLAKEFLPYMEEFVQQFKDPEFQREFKEIVKGLADLAVVALKAGAGIGAFLGNIAGGDDTLKDLIERAKGLRTEIGRLESGGGLLRALGNDPAKDIADFRAELVKTEAQIESMRSKIVPDLMSGILGNDSGGVTIPLRLQADRRPPPGLAPPVDKDALREQRAAVRDAAREEEKLAEQRQQYIEDTIAGIQAETEARRDALESIEEFILTEEESLAQSYARRMEIVRAAVDDRIISETRAAEIIDKLDKKQFEDILALADANKEAAEETSEFWKAAAQKIEGALADFLFDPFKEGLDGLIQDFARTLQRMVADAAAAQIGQYLFGSGSGGTGGIIGGIVNAGIGYFASGSSGVATPGVNDADFFNAGNVSAAPKMAVPSVGDVPMSKSKSGAVTTINQNFTIEAPQGSISRQTQSQIAATAARGLDQARRRRGA